MQKNTPNKDFQTDAYILRRTNYSEADRILNIITPYGKISAIARGVRREKSKLAGGIEVFSLVNLNIHTGKSDLATITGAKMIEYYSNIIKDLTKIEIASEIIKKINQVAEGTDNPDFFDILKQSLKALDQNVNPTLVQIWFLFNQKRASGEEINLYRDQNGKKLDADKKYIWDFYEKALTEKPDGDISASEIKLMRMISTNKLATITKIKNIDEMLPSIFPIAKSF